MIDPKDRLAAWLNAPLTPDDRLPADARTVNALEYIAGQLFLIRQSLDKERSET